jgi:cytochrome c oxidase subunit 2
MPIVVIATTDEGYKDWVAQQKGGGAAAEAETNKVWAMKELMAKGEQVYSRICSACHQPGGVGMAPTYPALKGSKIATGDLAGHVDIVFNGKSGTAMQAFKGQLSDAEIAAIITYERNSFGNSKGDLVQPAQIKALRDGKSMADALATKPSGKVSATPTKTASATMSVAAAATPAAATTAAAPAANLSPADALKAAITRGEKVYLNTCAVCHQPTGAGMPPTFPALKGSKIVTGPVAGHIHQVLFGKPGTAMQAFKDQLNDQDIADVVTYERNSWGNNTGTLVKPEDIKAARQQN